MYDSKILRLVHEPISSSSFETDKIDADPDTARTHSTIPFIVPIYVRAGQRERTQARANGGLEKLFSETITFSHRPRKIPPMTKNHLRVS